MMTCEIKINGTPIYLLEFVNQKFSIGLKTLYSVRSTHFDEKTTEDRLGTHYMVKRNVWHDPKDGALKLLQEGILKIGEKRNDLRTKRRKLGVGQRDGT